MNEDSTYFSVEINKDILKNQITDKIKEEILPKLSNKGCGYGKYSVLTPVLSGGHFYLLEVSVKFIRNQSEIDLQCLDATIHNSMSRTSDLLVAALKLTLNFSEFGNFIEDIEVNNLGQQHDGYSCGPRVIKMMMDKLKIYSYDIMENYQLIEPLSKLANGENPYKEVVNLLKEADETKKSKYLLSFLPKI